ncbi:hypothetical protein [Sorangium sp. So ce363]|uniref:hypothetical protein n=1 Tax=Sorangium sp. So ce363 TaxID=3133304 RepID=UPI003F648527
MPIEGDWRFAKGDPPESMTDIAYSTPVVKAWMLSTGHDFVKNPANLAVWPDGNLGSGVT